MSKSDLLEIERLWEKLSKKRKGARMSITMRIMDQIRITSIDAILSCVQIIRVSYTDSD